MNDLNMKNNKVPEEIRTVHFMGICGTGMGSLAGMMKEKGFTVTGSDTQVYPPMSTFLESLGIRIMLGYSPENLAHNPDLVIVGNVISRPNPEAQELARLGIPFVSFPQALRHFFLKGRTSLVVAGTHGKTTTSSIMASVLHHGGTDPGFMIGGIVKAFGRNYRIGSRKYFVVEGDEYDTAFFDKGPKFLHYCPALAIITSVEFDHADIYKDFDAVKAAFKRLAGIVNGSGAIVACLDSESVREVIGEAKCEVISYGLSKNCRWVLDKYNATSGGSTFSVIKDNSCYGEFSSPLIGRHNALNTLAVIAALERCGISRTAIQAGLNAFEGVRRRQEIRGIKNGICVIDDFAHHPTAVRETLEAIRAAYNGRRLIAVFEPRTNSSRRKVFQKNYASAFDRADAIVIVEAPGLEKIPEQERFSSQTLVDDLKKRNLNAHYFPGTDSALEFLKKECRTGDVVTIMSNGGFDNIHQRLLDVL